MKALHFDDPAFVRRYAEGPGQFVPGYEVMQRMAAQLLAERVPADGEVLVLGAGGGLELEAFTTAGGAETLCRRLQGKVRELTFKTLRYPGHLDLIRFLIEDLGLKERRHLLATLFRNGLPEIHQDLLIALVTVRGEVGGVLTERCRRAKAPACSCSTSMPHGLKKAGGRLPVITRW